MKIYKKGSKGEKVKEIQSKLKELGYYQDKIDGLFGPKTEAAVMAFQRDSNLRVDGIVDETTFNILFSRESLKINRGIRLDSKDYIADEIAKDLIVIHHTVGGSIFSTIHFWKTDPLRIGTAYLIERDGEIYEVFDPKYWAYHIGLKDEPEIDKRSIGIELANEGALIERGGKLYCFGRVTERTLFEGEYYDHGTLWRGYRFFASYTEKQISSLIDLINYLCERFDIPKQTPANHLDANELYRKFKGILGHNHLRPDKTDPHPGFPWQRIVEACKLKLV